MKQLKTSIIISGEICSGKSTLAKELSKKVNVPIASFGSYLTHYCSQHNVESTRRNLQDVGESFIQKDPKAFLMEVIKFSGGNSYQLIFEGVRHKVILAEIISLSSATKLIYLETPEPIRHQRYNSRDGQNHIDIDSFRAKCNHPVEQDIKLLKPKANLILDGSKKIDELVETIENAGLL